MSRSVSLPAIKASSNRHNRPSWNEREGKKAILPTVQELVVRESLKKCTLWFLSWRNWQQRVFVCHMMQHCSTQQLRVLATVLEPVLHIGFSSSLLPHLASLHIDGAATFHVQRGMLRRVVDAESLEPRSSVAHLPSLPTTLLSSEKTGTSDTCCAQEHSEQAGKTTGRGQTVTLPPVLPLTHTKHAPLSPESSLEDVQALRHNRFSSVPDFRSTSDLLQGIKQHKNLLRPRNHKRSQSLGSYLHTTYQLSPIQGQREAESFKKQLASVSQWMLEWPAKHQSRLLLEIVKLCNKDNMLAYFVQCLHQRLSDQMGVDSLSDSLLLKIFSHLDPRTLCRCAQVCQRWYRVARSAPLWEQHCSELGRREGVGDLATAVRRVCEQQEGGTTVDWKQAYRELCNVIWQIRQLVLKAAAEKDEKEQEMTERRAASRLTRAALRTGLSLREMIELVRSQSHASLSNVQEVLDSAPESATTIRRRNRRERREREEERLREESVRALSSRYQHRRPYDRSTPSSRLESHIMEEDESFKSVYHPHKSTTPDIIELIHEAHDHHSGLFYLPSPDGIRCLVLAGCLMADQPHRPGKTQPIPRLRRLPPLYSMVLCLQCDQKKIVCGMQSREIQIYDIRSGRLVNTFIGHKGSVQCLQFDEHKVVSGSWDTTCIVWDVVSGAVIQELVGHTGCISSLQFNQLKLVTGSHDKSLCVWSTTTWDCTSIIGHAHHGPVTCIAINNSIIASGATDCCVKLWSLITSEPLASLAHSAPLTSLLLSHLLLVSACQSGSVKLWSMEPHLPKHSPITYTLRKRGSKSHSQTDADPDDDVTPALQSPVTEWQLENDAHLTDMVLEGDKIFACGSGCHVYEWDIATGMFTRSLTGHSRPLTCVGITHNKLVSAAEDHTVCVWYYRKSKNMSKDEADELMVEASDPAFPDIPIRVINA